MPPPRESIRFRRVLIGLGTSAESRAFLETAADLAACFESPLAGLYVEDEDVFAFASLPIGREVSLTSAQVLDLTHDRLRVHFRNQASQVRRILEAAAAARRIGHSFELRRGRPERELRRAAKEWDLLAVGPEVGAISRPRRYDPGRRLWKSAAGGLLTFSGSPLTFASGPIAAVFTGTPASERGVQAALQIARRLGREVLIAPLDIGNGSPDPGRRLKDLVGGADNVSVLEPGEAGRVLAALAPRRPGLVIMPPEAVERAGPHKDRFGFPLLIIRTGDD